MKSRVAEGIGQVKIECKNYNVVSLAYGYTLTLSAHANPSIGSKSLLFAMLIVRLHISI